MHPDDIVLGGGGVKEFKTLPTGCRPGDNANAFLGGFRMWNGLDATDQPVEKMGAEHGKKA
jgi:polyphosphate glucokinase